MVIGPWEKTGCISFCFVVRIGVRISKVAPALQSYRKVLVRGAWMRSGEGEGAPESFGGGAETREHLANERTLLSWVRTGVGLISLGLVVERTGVIAGVSSGSSELFGLALAVLGCAALVMGTSQFLNNRRRISEGAFVPVAAAYLVIVAGGLALAGAFILYVLLS
jgi:putative membrane protein